MTAPQPAAVAWQPANDTERAMADALVQGDRREFFRLLANSELYLPAFAVDRSGAAPQRFITITMFDQLYLPVFTSVPGLTTAVGTRVDAYTVTTYPELRRKWPDPAWRLAVNPGAPIDAYLTVEAVQDAALGDVAIPTAAEILEEGQRSGAGGDARAGVARLSAAIEDRDPDGYFRALLETDVIVPVTRPVSPEQVLEPDFPWLRVSAPGVDADPDDRTPCPTIEVFTSVENFRAGYPSPVPSVAVTMLAVVVAWPGDEDQLAIDPRTPMAVTLSGDHVAGLVLWLPDEDRPESLGGAPPAGPRALPGPADQPPATGATPAERSPAGHVPPGARATGVPPAEAPRPRAAAPVELPPWATGR